MLQFSFLEPAWRVAQLAHPIDEGREAPVGHAQCVLKLLTREKERKLHDYGPCSDGLEFVFYDIEGNTVPEVELKLQPTLVTAAHC